VSLSCEHDPHPFLDFFESDQRFFIITYDFEHSFHGSTHHAVRRKGRPDARAAAAGGSECVRTGLGGGQ